MFRLRLWATCIAWVIAAIVFLPMSCLAGTPKASDAGCRDDPTLIIPGRCIGPITAGTTFRTLSHGLPGHVVRGGLSVDEGGHFCITTIDPGTPSELDILWTTGKDVALPNLEDEAKATCANFDFGDGVVDSVNTIVSSAARISPAVASQAPWHTKEGLRLGMDLAHCRKLWPRKVTIFGYGWDYGGLATLSKGLRAWTGYDQAREQLLTPEQLDSASGMAVLEADDPVLAILNPYLVAFVIEFPVAGDQEAPARRR
jgi:hypothetical protein